MGTQSITSNGGGATGTISIEEGNTAVTTVTAEASIAFVYSISGGADAALFTINSSTGALAFSSPAEPGSYTVTVRATDPDNSAFDEQTFNITVPITPVGSEEFIGSGIGSALLSNIRIIDGSPGTHINETEMACTGIVAEGNTITGVKQYIIYTTAASSGYHSGDGGTWKVEIQGHDAINNRPNGTVLAESYEYVVNTQVITTNEAAQTKYPGCRFPAGSGTQRLRFPLFELTTTLNTTPGTKYWVCTKQVRGGSSNFVSIDHTRNRHQYIRAQLDPNFVPDMQYRVLMRHTDGTWVDKSASAAFGLISVIEIIGDTNYGMCYYGTPNSADIPYADRCGELSTSKRVRQEITFASETTLSSLSIAAGKNSGSTPITCTIRQGNSVLHTATLSGYPSLTTSGQNVVTIHNEIGWVTVPLPDVVVAAEIPVYFDLSTASGTVYKIPLLKDGNGFYFNSGTLVNGVAYYSENSGASWTQAGNTDIGIALLGTT